MKKKKERKVMEKEDRIVDMAYEDAKEFLLKKTKHWGNEKDSGSFVAYGLLNAVFEALFHMAPSKKDAMEIVSMSLMNFVTPDELGLEDGPPEEEYDPSSEAEREDEYRAVEAYENSKKERGYDA